MTRVEYTHWLNDWDSSVISQAFYNANEKKLYIVFVSGNVYGWDKVPLDLFERFVTAKSRGSFYNDYIKGQFDSEYFASASGVNTVQVPIDPKEENPAGDEKVVNLFNLNTEPPLTGTKRKHIVKFTKGTDPKILEHTVTTSSVDDAVNGINEFASALNLELKIKEVVVKFD